MMVTFYTKNYLNKIVDINDVFYKPFCGVDIAFEKKSKEVVNKTETIKCSQLLERSSQE